MKMNSLAMGSHAEGKGRVGGPGLTPCFSSICVLFSVRRSSLFCSASVLSLVLFCSAAARPQSTVQSASVAHGAPNAPAESDLLSQVIANQKRTDAALELFERIQRVEIRRAANDPKPSEVKVWRVFPAGTGLDKIPLSPEAKPVNEESYRTELQKLERQLVWAAQQGPAQQEAYAKLQRKQKERNDLIDATHDAFIFTPVGEEHVGDRELLRYDIAPNPKYRPTSRNTTLFTKVRGSVWIDPQAHQLARIEGRVTEDISLGLFLARVNKGSHFFQERREIAPGTWLPTYEQYDFDGRKYWFSFSIHERTSYSGYHRVGPPKEAIEVVRTELSKNAGDKADP